MTDMKSDLPQDETEFEEVDYTAESDGVSDASESSAVRFSDPRSELRKRVTGHLEASNAIPWGMSNPFGLRRGSAQIYLELPIHLARGEHFEERPHWRIEMHGLASNAEPLGLDIIGDVVLGRGESGPNAPDLDLNFYDALDHGVSRRHALLRPSSNHLFIIDLGSTNGTMINAISLGAGVARPLMNDDTVTMGRLTFTLRIIDGPGIRQAEEAQKRAMRGVLPRGVSTKKLNQQSEDD